MSGEGFVWESSLIQLLGMNRDELRRLRCELLTEGQDWLRKKNGRVLVHKLGIEKIRAHLDVPPTPVQAAGLAETAPAEPAPKNAALGDGEERVALDKAEVTLLVHRANLPNRRIIEAYHVGKDPADRKNVVRVKVKDNQRFTRFDNNGKPMKLQAVHLTADYYEQVGPSPRRKGRY